MAGLLFQHGIIGRLVKQRKLPDTAVEHVIGDILGEAADGVAGTSVYA